MTVYAYMYAVSGISGLNNIVLASYSGQSMNGASQTQRSYVLVREF